MDSRAEAVQTQNVVIGMRNKTQGFTLVEILVVVLIIGISLGFVLLSVGHFGQDQRLKLAADQFMQDLKFVQQQAILESSTLGIAVTKDSYQLLRFKPPHTWQAFTTKALLKQRSFPQHTHAHFQGRLKAEPQIVIHSSGELDPFILQLSSSKKSIQIISQRNGNLALNTEVPNEK